MKRHKEAAAPTQAAPPAQMMPTDAHVSPQEREDPLKFARVPGLQAVPEQGSDDLLSWMKDFTDQGANNGLDLDRDWSHAVDENLAPLQPQTSICPPLQIPSDFLNTTHASTTTPDPWVSLRLVHNSVHLYPLKDYRADSFRTGFRLDKNGNVQAFSRQIYLFESMSTDLTGPKCGRCGKPAVHQLKDPVLQDEELVCSECKNQVIQTRPSSSCRHLMPATRIKNPIMAFENLLLLALNNRAATEQQRVDMLVALLKNFGEGNLPCIPVPMSSVDLPETDATPLGRHKSLHEWKQSSVSLSLLTAIYYFIVDPYASITVRAFLKYTHEQLQHEMRWKHLRGRSPMMPRT